MVDKKTFRKLQNRYEDAVFAFEQYIKKNHKISFIITEACYLAHLEHVFRSGMPPTNIEKFFDKTDSKIVNDLKNISEVFEKSFLSVISEKSNVIFNPTFGKASLCCNGADADIFIDGTLYDFKTTKKNGYNWKEVAQIIGYFFLNRLQIRWNCDDDNLNKMQIEKVAFYKARFGEIECFDINNLGQDIIVSTEEKLDKYFKKYKEIYFI